MAGKPEKTAEQRLAALRPLIQRYREQQAAAYDTLEEVVRLLDNGTDYVKQLADTFDTLWGARYGGTKYAWSYAKDRAQLKRLLRMFSPEDLEARMGKFIRTNDPFLANAKHTFGLFVTNVNRYVEERPTDDFALHGAPPSGCTHQPHCVDDEAHTRRMNAERRAVGGAF